MYDKLKIDSLTPKYFQGLVPHFFQVITQMSHSYKAFYVRFF